MGNTNLQRAEELVRTGDLRCGWSPEMAARPWLTSERPTRPRWRGMFLGLAIGDSLGNTSEGMNPSARYAHHGEIRNYLPNRHAEGRKVGLPSDDTQLCAWAVEQILRDGCFEPSAYMTILSKRNIFGIGSTTRKARCAWRKSGQWLSASQHSAGNGALMRAPAIFAAHLGRERDGLGADAALLAGCTHNDPAAISSAVAFTLMLEELLVMPQPPPATWWVDRYVELGRPMEGATTYTGRGAPRALDYEGPLWQFVQQKVGSALRAGETCRQACDGWHSGAYLLETMPSVLMILAQHGANPEEAMIRAINDTRDNDTIGAIVGAAVGALHGEDALPAAWRDGLLGRIGEADDTAFFELLDKIGV